MRRHQRPQPADFLERGRELFLPAAMAANGTFEVGLVKCATARQQPAALPASIFIEPPISRQQRQRPARGCREARSPFTIEVARAPYNATSPQEWMAGDSRRCRAPPPPLARAWLPMPTLVGLGDARPITANSTPTNVTTRTSGRRREELTPGRDRRGAVHRHEPSSTRPAMEASENRPRSGLLRPARATSASRRPRSGDAEVMERKNSARGRIGLTPSDDAARFRGYVRERSCIGARRQNNSRWLSAR